MKDYETPVDDFLEEHGVKFICAYSNPQTPPLWEKKARDKWVGTKWDCNLLRGVGAEIGGMRLRSPLWCGAMHTSEPSAYTFISCLQLYDPGSFREWCDEFGSEGNAADLLDSWEECVSQWRVISKMFKEKELEALRELAR